MKYMFVMRATDEALEASKQVPFEEVVNRMGAYNESLINAGVLLGGEGLAPILSQVEAPSGLGGRGAATWSRKSSNPQKQPLAVLSFLVPSS